jgi:hypothetical protein
MLRKVHMQYQDAEQQYGLQPQGGFSGGFHRQKDLQSTPTLRNQLRI